MAEAHDPTAPVWHIMTRTRGGTVSLIKNLDEATARQTMQRLRTVDDMVETGDPWSDDALWRATENAARREDREKRGEHEITFHYLRQSTAHDSDLIQVECFGPEGVELTVWPKPADYDERYASALQEARTRVAASGDNTYLPLGTARNFVRAQHRDQAHG